MKKEIAKIAKIARSSFSAMYGQQNSGFHLCYFSILYLLHNCMLSHCYVFCGALWSWLFNSLLPFLHAHVVPHCWRGLMKFRLSASPGGADWTLHSDSITLESSTSRAISRCELAIILKSDSVKRHRVTLVRIRSTSWGFIQKWLQRSYDAFLKLQVWRSVVIWFSWSWNKVKIANTRLNCWTV